MNRLRALRLDRGLSQFELAEATNGVWRRWKVQLVEVGHLLPSPEERQVMAAALNVPECELFPETKPEKKR